MIHLRLALFAETIIRDAETNAMTIVNLIDNLTAPAFPMGLGKLSVLFVMRRDDGDPRNASGVLTFELDAIELGQLPVSLDFEDKPQTRLMVVFQGLVIPAPGTLRATLTIDATVVGSCEAAVLPGALPRTVSLPN
jgi:hypothetical protein